MLIVLRTARDEVEAREAQPTKFEESFGNLVWRIVCELWIVLFNIHARLASIDDEMHLDRLPTPSFADAIKSQARDRSLPTRVPRETIHETKETYETARHASVLGLS